METVQEPGPSSRGGITLTCEECRGSFRRFASTATGARFCSRACKAKNRTSVGIAKLSCAVCGQAVTRRRSMVGYVVLCGRKCQNAIRGNMFVRVCDAQVEHCCAGCKRVYFRLPARGGVGFCSRSCWRASQRGVERIPRTDPQQCNGCLVFKPLTTGFSLLKGSGLYSLRCKECRNLKGTSSEAKRRSHLRTKFQMTLEQWIDMHRAQGGLCAICDVVLPPVEEATRSLPRGTSWKRRNWNTDHCHKTGKVRGILCRSCNHALGALRDSPAIARRAADYLERHAT